MLNCEEQGARELASKTEKEMVFTDNDFKYSMSGLIGRGVIDTRMVIFQENKFLNVFITEKGLDALAQYEKGDQ